MVRKTNNLTLCNNTKYICFLFMRYTDNSFHYSYIMISLNFIVLIVGIVLIPGIQAASCDCKYNYKGLFTASGCYISKAPPMGYRCYCWYKGAWSCGGIAKKCLKECMINPNPCKYHYIEGQCSGCKHYWCCVGDCEGYSKK